MTLPYSTATSGERAVGEIQKILRGFGCSKFGTMLDDQNGELLLQFEYRGRMVSIKASMKGYAAAWLTTDATTSLHGTTSAASAWCW